MLADTISEEELVEDAVGVIIGRKLGESGGGKTSKKLSKKAKLRQKVFDQLRREMQKEARQNRAEGGVQDTLERTKKYGQKQEPLGRNRRLQQMRREDIELEDMDDSDEEWVDVDY